MTGVMPGHARHLRDCPHCGPSYRLARRVLVGMLATAVVLLVWAAR